MQIYGRFAWQEWPHPTLSWGNGREDVRPGDGKQHLRLLKHSPEGHHSGNSRSGKGSKIVQSSQGSISIDVPRDRNGDFDPQIVKKRQTHINAFDDKIISMYARGMSPRDIQAHIAEIYGVDISPTMISNITDKVLEVVKEWQNRPLSKIYPITYFDAIHYKVRPRR